MKKKLIYIGILVSMVTIMFAGCGSAADKTDQAAKTEKKQADFDDIQIGLTKDQLIKTYGEPEATVSDNTEVIQRLTTDMTAIQTEMTDEAQQQQLVHFFGGTEEKMQEALNDMLDSASEGMELLEYNVAGEELSIYIVGEKVLLRTF
ncbi:hypothetical protein [Candidatus Enterococcus clewellii]|uniref:YusW-like protein n=1 Tax=Candidatus Enterococcus clewellii TaxID=1834193 RepID=A0AAQ3VV43_9ENTE